MKRAAILFSDFGPYHVARIQALRDALQGRGDSLHAFRFTEASDDYAWRPEVPEGVPVVTLAKGKPRGVFEAAKMAANFGRELRNRQIDTVFLPTYSPLPNLFCFLAAKAVGCRTILMTESWRGTENASLPGRLIKHALVRMFDSALVGGTPQTDYVVAYGMPRQKVFTGYDVVNVEHFSKRAEEFRASQQRQQESGVRGRADAGSRRSEVGDRRTEAGGPDALIKSLPARYFLNLGRFVEKKNLATLVSAYAKCCDECPVASDESGPSGVAASPQAEGPVVTSHRIPATRYSVAALVLVGEGPLRGDLERQARDLGLAVRDGMADANLPGGPEVVFYPFQQADVTPLFFARCEAFVLPSTREEWGLVVNEAMACGAPVLVSNRVGAHFDLVEEEVNGFTFEPEDVSGLAELLGRFDAEIGLRNRLGAGGRRLIEAWKPARFGESGVAAMMAALASK